MRKAQLALVGVLAVAIAAGTGCSALNPEKTSSPSSSQGQAGPKAEKVMPTTVYVKDANGYVVPLNVKMAQTLEVAKATLEHMVQGSSGDAALVGTGLINPLPKGTVIRGVNIDKETGLATVDLSKEVLTSKTEAEEQAIVDSIVWTMTGFEGVKKVQLKVEGHKQSTLPKGTPVADPISRENGINLQLSKNVSPSNSSKVTLYFSGANASGDYTYLVPVTRVIPKVANENPVDLTLAELAKGPNADGLGPVMASTLKPLKVELNGKVATLDFGDDFKVAATPEGKNLVNSIVLSVAANAGVEQVQFTINGKAPESTAASSGVDLSKPVGAPAVINAQKL
jgi:germination protein M